MMALASSFCDLFAFVFLLSPFPFLLSPFPSLLSPSPSLLFDEVFPLLLPVRAGISFVFFRYSILHSHSESVGRTHSYRFAVGFFRK